MRPRLVLHGLPRELAHAPLRALPAVRIELVAAAEVRGRVLDAATEAPIAGALVSCGDVRAARSDAEGRFELLQLPPGANRIDAQLDLRHGRQVLSRRGSQPVQLRAGEPLDDLVVRID